jgi:hypothetical protein
MHHARLLGHKDPALVETLLGLPLGGRQFLYY